MRLNYKKHQGWIENLAILMQVGLTMAGCIVFCFFVGFYLDRWIGTHGVFIALFTLLGVIGGAVTVYRQIREILEPKAKDRSEEEDP
jgi:F0F1-type ATP synthase assembly protein I